MEGVTASRAGVLRGHRVCPSVDHVSPPLGFFGFGRTPWIDRRQSHSQLRKHVAVIVGHGVVSSHEHPLRWVELSDERPQKRLVLHSMQLELGGGDRSATSCLQFSRDPLVDVLVNDEQWGWWQSSCRLVVSSDSSPPLERVGDLVVIHPVSLVEVFAATGLFSQLRNEFRRYTRTSDDGAAAKPVRVNLDVLQSW